MTQEKTKHIFQVPFTGKTPRGDNMTDEWFEKRVEIFIKYTIGSLKYQTNKDFLLWLTFRPEDRDSIITIRIEQALEESGIKHILTFNGTMFTEDRATWHNKDLPERLERALPILKKFVGDCDYIYETNLDSDDMVHKDFSKFVIEKKFKNKGALYCTRGFAYNTQGRIADWNNPVSNQNYTLMFPSDIYFDADRRLEYLRGYKSHEEVPEMFDSEKLPDGFYCTVIHGDNITTEWNHPFRGNEYFYEDEKEEILKNFL